MAKNFTIRASKLTELNRKRRTRLNWALEEVARELGGPMLQVDITYNACYYAVVEMYHPSFHFGDEHFHFFTMARAIFKSYGLNIILSDPDIDARRYSVIVNPL